MAVGLEGVVRFKVDWIKMDYWLPVGGCGRGMRPE